MPLIWKTDKFKMVINKAEIELAYEPEISSVSSPQHCYRRKRNFNHLRTDCPDAVNNFIKGIADHVFPLAKLKDEGNGDVFGSDLVWVTDVYILTIDDTWIILNYAPQIIAGGDVMGLSRTFKYKRVDCPDSINAKIDGTKDHVFPLAKIHDQKTGRIYPNNEHDLSTYPGLTYAEE